MNPYKKGYRVEREIRKIFEDSGWQVVRSAGSHTNTDLFVRKQNKTFSIQVKARKTFSVLSMIENADILIIKPDRKEPYVVIKLTDFLKLME